MGLQVDLNVDVGEHSAARDDEALLGLATSVSVACGFHAGSAETMRRLCASARSRGVRIGAHVSFPDPSGFGRREMGLTPSEIADIAVYQVGALVACAHSVGAHVSYLKPHGALYHRVGSDRLAAVALIEALLSLDHPLAILAAPRSELLAAAEAAGLAGIREGFADRAYDSDGRLVDRGRPGSELGPREAAAQAVALATGPGAGAGVELADAFAVQSICLHSDSPRPVETARAVVGALDAAGIDLRPFA